MRTVKNCAAAAAAGEHQEAQPARAVGGELRECRRGGRKSGRRDDEPEGASACGQRQEREPSRRPRLCGARDDAHSTSLALTQVAAAVEEETHEAETQLASRWAELTQEAETQEAETQEADTQEADTQEAETHEAETQDAEIQLASAATASFQADESNVRSPVTGSGVTKPFRLGVRVRRVDDRGGRGGVDLADAGGRALAFGRWRAVSMSAPLT